MNQTSNYDFSSLKIIVSKYHKADTKKSILQLLNTFIPFFALLVLMGYSIQISYWLTLILAIPTAGFLVRIFIFQHDCGHQSFFNNKKYNDLVGRFCSVFTWTPYAYWRKGHSIHHANASKLDMRGIGDIYTMTVREYLQRSKFGRLKYRLYRNPVFLFLFIPTILFVIIYRFPTSQNKALKAVERSVYLTNLAIAISLGVLIFLFGWKMIVLVYLPVIIFAASAGNWLFYVQHQFEETYWEHAQNWDYTLAAMQGSSYYKLPKILQWFTGNIGFHHIHHLSPRIPNYYLQKCYKENEVFTKTTTLTFRSSLKSIFLTLWDEEKRKLIGFKDLNPQN